MHSLYALHSYQITDGQDSPFISIFKHGKTDHVYYSYWGFVPAGNGRFIVQHFIFSNQRANFCCGAVGWLYMVGFDRQGAGCEKGTIKKRASGTGH
jgi:hypothetical protein